MKKYISVFVLVIVFLALGTGSSKAVLQSNGNTPATYNVDNWMLNIRKMEELGLTGAEIMDIENNLR